MALTLMTAPDSGKTPPPIALPNVTASGFKSQASDKNNVPFPCLPNPHIISSANTNIPLKQEEKMIQNFNQSTYMFQEKQVAAPYRSCAILTYFLARPSGQGNAT